jgi:hypothetical protein
MSHNSAKFNDDAPLTTPLRNAGWPLFEDATRAIFGSWTTIRLALEHSFAGKKTAAFVYDLVECTLDMFALGRYRDHQTTTTRTTQTTRATTAWRF